MGPQAHITAVESSKTLTLGIMVRNIIAHYCIVCAPLLVYKKKSASFALRIPRRLRFFIMRNVRLLHSAFTRRKRCKVEIGKVGIARLESPSRSFRVLHIYHTYKV